MTPLRVLAVTSEIYPIVKTGGLADVAGALPAALQTYGIETRTLVPGYPDVIKALPAVTELLQMPRFFGGPARLLGGSHGNLDLLVLDAPHLFARPGNPYLGPDGQDWPDNAIRFAALSRVAAGGAAARNADFAAALHPLAATVAPIPLFRYHRTLLRQRALIAHPLQPRLVAEAMLIGYRELFR